MVPKRIEIAGCIASGKTTLVDALAGSRFQPIYEDHAINPFWTAFYAEPSAHTFETEITFLLQHYHFVKVAKPGPQGVTILDHSFELDMAYAEVGLRGNRKDIFKSIYQEVRQEIGSPIALVFITCSVEEAARRIRERGRAVEVDVSLEFLAKLQGALKTRVAQLAHEIPVISMDSEAVDFREKGKWLTELSDKLHSIALKPR